MEKFIRWWYVALCVIGLYASIWIVWVDGLLAPIFLVVAVFILWMLTIELTPSGTYHVGPLTFRVGPRDKEDDE